MAIAAALPGFNDLGRPVTPTFFCRYRFYSQLSPHCPKMNKKSMWEVKKIKDFGTSKVWSLNTNLFFKEPRQLTKLTQ